MKRLLSPALVIALTSLQISARLQTDFEKPKMNIASCIFDAAQIIDYTGHYSEETVQTSKDSREIVTTYLNLLKKLDQKKMEQYLAEDFVVKDVSGNEGPYRRDWTRNMRDFEREVKTVWRWKILKVQNNEVTVELSEGNEFYDWLGVGDRKQVDIYFVRNGRIYRREVTSSNHEKADLEKYGKIYQSFKDWLSTTALVNDKSVMTEGILIFDGKNAKIIMSWLKKWNKQLKGSD